MTGFLILNAQTVSLEGIVSDTLNRPLHNANILAVPASSDHKIKFTISDINGNYGLQLSKGIYYSLQVSFLGYKSFNDSIVLFEDSLKDVMLANSNISLDEVIISERTPVKIREDTITYRPDKFLTGTERKLKDVLKKLPGLDVDRDGNVKVNGKDVTKLLVDGKEFFTGDEKLGVNNIPADVIDEIEALDNYCEIAFLKGLSDSEQLALNIKLKEGKKKFLFGEVEAGTGIEQRYIVHPTLFYYSPNTTVNIIGDFNNVGQKSFTVQDYVNFEGGYARFGEDSQAIFRLFNDDFAQFLTSQDFVFNKNNLGALSLNQNITKNLNISAYSILYVGNVITKDENFITYLNDDSTQESRRINRDSDINFSLTKATLRYKTNTNFDLKYDVFLKTNNARGIENTISQTDLDSTFVIQSNRPDAFDFTQKLSINKQFSKTHTSALNLSYKFLNSDVSNLWNFNAPVFSEIILINDSGSNSQLRQQRENKLNEIKSNLKHYWVLNPTNHVYFEVGFNRKDQSYQTLDTQELNDDSVSFQDNGFNNDIQFDLTESYFGLQYKGRFGKFLFKPGLFYHIYDWRIQQFQDELRNTRKGVVLPQLQVDWKLNSAHQLKLKYNRFSNFGEAWQLANRFTLQSFNQLFAGNSDLENELYNRISLSYSKFSIFKGNIFNARLSYTNREQSIRTVTRIENIDQINTLIYTDLPENLYSGSASFTKLLGDFKLELGTSGNYSSYSRVINEIIQDFTSFNYGYQFGGTMQFKRGPNISLNVLHNFSDFQSASSSNRFMTITPAIEMQYSFFKDFLFTAKYDFTYYENQNQKQINRFNIGDASLLYNKEGSPWSFTIESMNIFNTQFRQMNSFTEFLVNDMRTGIQPRVVLFKLGYRF